MPVLSFRAASEADVGAVVTLVESAYRGDASRQGWTTEADLLDGRRTDAASVAALLPELVLADDGAELVGCCHLQLQAGAPAYFGMFAVQPGLQGRGTGGALLAEAERRAAATGAPAVRMTVLTPRAELIAWYERRGYRRTGERESWPYGDERFGVPRSDDLTFEVLEKRL